MEHTGNFQLSQWEATDRIQMQDFNADNAKIDAALAALSAASAGHGNCQLYYTTYVGTGEVGAAHPNTVVFPRKPLFTAVLSTLGYFTFFLPGADRALYHHESDAFTTVRVSWNGAALSWYGDSSLASNQMNSQGSLYHVFAIYQADAE